MKIVIITSAKNVIMCDFILAIVEHCLSKSDQLPSSVPLPLLKECLMNLRQLETFLSVILVGFKNYYKVNNNTK